MKKVISVLLSATLVLGLAACGGSSSATTAADTAAATTAAATTTAEAAADTTEAEKAETTTGAAEAKTQGSAEITDAGVKTSGVLVMSTNAEFPPYEFHDSSSSVGVEDFAGIDVEVAKAIAEKMGCELKIEDIAFDSIIPQISSGMADMGMAGMTVTEDRKQNVDFSETYATSRQVIVVKEGSEITGIESLAGKKIGVQLGTTGDILASDDASIGDGIERYNKAMEAIQALSQDMLDAVIVDLEPAKVFVKEVSGLKILDEAYTDEEYAICVKKGNTELLDNINAALAAIKADGTLDKIVDKYINAN